MWGSIRAVSGYLGIRRTFSVTSHTQIQIKCATTKLKSVTKLGPNSLPSSQKIVIHSLHCTGVSFHWVETLFPWPVPLISTGNELLETCPCRDHNYITPEVEQVSCQSGEYLRVCFCNYFESLRWGSDNYRAWLPTLRVLTCTEHDLSRGGLMPWNIHTKGELGRAWFSNNRDDLLSNLKW